MKKYIDADKLREIMYHEAFETDTEMQRWDSGCWIRYKMFENALEQMPTADVQKVQHGKWESIVIGGEVWGTKCSKCHAIDLYGKTPYCPNCGSRMDLEKDE